MLSVKHAVPLLLLSLLLGACTVQYDNVQLVPNGQVRLTHMTPDMQNNIQQLEAALIALDPAIIDPREARAVAHDAYVYPLYLANDWDLTWPPLLHNTLRNADQRKAGLCVDWARAMRARMRAKNLQTFDLYWGVANKGNPWREHSTLIVTAKGKPFASGILLDPWRDSGRLFWSRVKEDEKYQWKYFEGPG
ncbi:MAG TPA: hypothetical protein PLE99_09550 [Candidatus Thiothrix moscowensis]|uniref:hypothetical protein n=1 Tax=unclassified Thiothrix TaxID=2636184 RepID=UPI001A1BF867|nr:MULTISPECIES: hypothetical protein [unclassified Thiothrix]MBJ6610578.1 hypothetical protein [Candidatus Thiothrix moscowensis]HRJ53003.1 hypothetical protein [Candidatus Thiothrix moscowensis]HRJ92953.1 hypothetical protein [Candidatus Thiothrix moscowensis]